MGATTEIAWTDATFNPWWGYQRVSPACENCYAQAWSLRTGYSGARLPLLWGPKSERRFFGESHWNEPLKWERDAERSGVRKRVFCASMADVFEDRPELDEPRAKLWTLIDRTPHLDWQLLTKRPENMVRMSPTYWAVSWPSNVWAGCTAENQKYANERLPELLRVPAAVRFVSYEPALGPVDFSPWLFGTAGDTAGHFVNGRYRSGGAGGQMLCERPLNAIHQIIVGGESGPGARSFDLDWAHDVIHQCADAGVAAFVKQLGAVPTVHRTDGGWPVGATLRGDGLGTFRVQLRDRKGGDMSEWPEGLRVRQFPTSGGQPMTRQGPKLTLVATCAGCKHAVAKPWQLDDYPAYSSVTDYVCMQSGKERALPAFSTPRWCPEMASAIASAVGRLPG